MKVSMFGVTLLLLALSGSLTLAEGPARSLGAGTGVVTASEREGPCGFLRIAGEGTYDNAYAWDPWFNQDPPYYCSFAEYFTGQSPEVCAVVLDLTKPGDFPPVLVDAFVWEHDAGADTPGNVLAIALNVDIGPVATWPDFTRVVVPLSYPAYPTGSWWAGFCLVGTFGYDYPVYYIGADQSYQPAQGRPFTNVAPDWGYPPGWQHVDTVWGYTSHLGIGILAHTVQPGSTPDLPGGEMTTWGRIKSLSR